MQIDRSATFRFYDSALACRTTEVGILCFEGAIRLLESDLQADERVFLISKKGGAQNMSSNFFEEQSGLLCAVHAAHNAVGCDGDPALSRDAFRVSAESYLRDDSSGN